MLFTVIGLPYHPLVLTPCSDHYASFCPRCTPDYICPSLSLLLVPLQASCVCSHSFVLRYSHHAVLFYVSFNFFNPLFFYSWSWGLCKPRLLLSCHQSKREFKYQRQKLDLWGVPQCWDSMKVKGRSKENLKLHAKRCQNSPDGIHSFIHSVKLMAYSGSSAGIYRHNRSKWNSKNSCPHRAYLLVRGDSNKHHT